MLRGMKRGTDDTRVYIVEALKGIFFYPFFNKHISFTYFNQEIFAFN